MGTDHIQTIAGLEAAAGLKVRLAVSARSVSFVSERGTDAASERPQPDWSLALTRCVTGRSRRTRGSGLVRDLKFGVLDPPSRLSVGHSSGSPKFQGTKEMQKLLVWTTAPTEEHGSKQMTQKQ